MALCFFLAGLLAKNYIYFSVLRKNKIPKYAFVIIGYIVMILSIGVGVFTLDNKDKGIVPMILNIDFLLLFFVMMIGLMYRLMNFVLGNSGVSNPFSMFVSVNLSLKHFYIAITIIQILLMLLCI